MNDLLLDAGYEGSLVNVGEFARRVELHGGFAGMWVSDTSNDPFLLAALGVTASSEIEVGTSVAVAFARSPFVVAQTAWNLAHLSGGRFTLGLGSQIKPHIEKRFSMPWPDSPAKAMEEYLELLRHLFECFSKGVAPSYKGEHYRCTLGSPVFTPDSHELAPPRLGISAVGEAMTRLAGRQADAVFLHPFTHLEYLRKVSLPALEEGKSRRPKDLGRLVLIGSTFTVATDHPEAVVAERKARERIAFYASTPGYLAVLRALDLEDLHADLHSLSRQGRWKEMAQILPEALLEACIVRAPLSELAKAVTDRFGGVYDRVLVDATPWLEETVA